MLKLGCFESKNEHQYHVFIFLNLEQCGLDYIENLKMSCIFQTRFTQNSQALHIGDIYH